MIVPIEHIESVNVLQDHHGAIVSKMMLKAKEIAETLGIRDSGYKLVINVGSGAGQVIFHLHVHLIGGWGGRKILLKRGRKQEPFPQRHKSDFFFKPEPAYLLLAFIVLCENQKIPASKFIGCL